MMAPMPKAIRFPDPDEVAVDLNGIRVIGLERFIELKLASGMTGMNRLRDLADIQQLIRDTGLSEGISLRLDPSVRDKYIELWRTAQIKDPLDE